MEEIPYRLMIVDTKKKSNLLHKTVIYMISQAKSTPLGRMTIWLDGVRGVRTTKLLTKKGLA
jgi:hypothetical protein